MAFKDDYPAAYNIYSRFFKDEVIEVAAQAEALAATRDNRAFDPAFAVCGNMGIVVGMARAGMRFAGPRVASPAMLARRQRIRDGMILK